MGRTPYGPEPYASANSATPALQNVRKQYYPSHPRDARSFPHLVRICAPRLVAQQEERYYRNSRGCCQVVRPQLPNPNHTHTAQYRMASELGIYTLGRTRWDYVSLAKVHQTCPPKKSGLRCWRPLCFALERVTGFEPANASLGSSCLTTWRHPRSEKW